MGNVLFASYILLPHIGQNNGISFALFIYLEYCRGTFIQISIHLLLLFTYSIKYNAHHGVL